VGTSGKQGMVVHGVTRGTPQCLDSQPVTMQYVYRPTVERQIIYVTSV